MALVFVFFGVEGGAHPWVDAALEAGFFILDDARARQGLPSVDEHVVSAGRLRNQTSINHSRAFRCGHRVARRDIQTGYKAAAELGHPREGVSLATDVGARQVDALFRPVDI